MHIIYNVLRYTSRNTYKPYICFISKILNYISFRSTYGNMTPYWEQGSAVAFSSLLCAFLAWRWSDRQETVCESDCLRQWEAKQDQQQMGGVVGTHFCWSLTQLRFLTNLTLSYQMYQRRVSAGNNLNAGFNLKFYIKLFVPRVSIISAL